MAALRASLQKITNFSKDRGLLSAVCHTIWTIYVLDQKGAVTASKVASDRLEKVVMGLLAKSEAERDAA
jgi:hypothetical protein